MDPIDAQMLGGPQDGLHVRVALNTRELRFPQLLDPGFISTLRATEKETWQMPVDVYERVTIDRFQYKRTA